MASSSSVEDVPESELICQFIQGDDGTCNNTMHSTTSNNESDQRREDVLDDSLLVDRSELLQDVLMTPDKNSSTNNTDNNKMTTNETALVPEVITELESQELKVGDHVYQWRNLCGVPYIFQHHGIIMDIIEDEEGKPARLTIADFSNVETKATKKNSIRSSINTKQQRNVTQDAKQSTESIGSESQIETEAICHPSRQEEIGNDIAKSRQSSRSTSRRLSLEQEGILRTYTDTDKWHKVHYQSGWWKCQVYRSGTVTKAKSDPVGLVLARVSFIMQHPEQLPDYHVVHANCECVAFWCKTGSWATLQASSFLELTAAG